MGAGSKVLAGCGCLTIVTALLLIAVLGLGLHWLKDRVDELAGGLEQITTKTDEIEAWERKANAHPFEPWEEGVIPEARLRHFLQVRRRVHAVYEPYRAELAELRRHMERSGERLTAADFMAMGGKSAEMWAELRLAQVQALAEVGMSEREYRAIQAAVYKAAGASKTEAETGRLPAEAVSEAAVRTREAVRAGIETAREEGLPGAARVTESDVERLDAALEQMGASGAEALAVPPENVALVRKYEVDIEKYAMHGIAFLGL